MTDPTDDTPRTRTDVVDRGREWLGEQEWGSWAESSDPEHLIRDLLAEVEALRAERVRLRGIILESGEALGLLRNALEEHPEWLTQHVKDCHGDMLRLHKEKVVYYLRITKLEEALRPFGDEATERDWTHDQDKYDHCIDGLSICTEQDFGAARAALEENDG